MCQPCLLSLSYAFMAIVKFSKQCREDIFVKKFILKDAERKKLFPLLIFNPLQHLLVRLNPEQNNINFTMSLLHTRSFLLHVEYTIPWIMLENLESISYHVCLSYYNNSCLWMWKTFLKILNHSFFWTLKKELKREVEPFFDLIQTLSRK